MRKASFADMHCSIAQSLDIVGERWTLLILRDAFLGVRRFDGFVDVSVSRGTSSPTGSTRLSPLASSNGAPTTSPGAASTTSLPTRAAGCGPSRALRQWGDVGVGSAARATSRWALGTQAADVPPRPKSPATNAAKHWTPDRCKPHSSRVLRARRRRRHRRNRETGRVVTWGSPQRRRVRAAATAVIRSRPAYSSNDGPIDDAPHRCPAASRHRPFQPRRHPCYNLWRSRFEHAPDEVVEVDMEPEAASS